MPKQNFPSYTNQNVAKIERPDLPRTRFSEIQNYKTMCDSGKLIPFLTEEVLPGDLWQVRTSAFARLQTQLVPFMDNIYMDMHYFFCPNRLVWDNWRAFCGEREDPADDPTTYTVPIVTCPAGGYAEESVYDYMGLPTKITNVDINALPLRAHNLIHKTWFRDQNIIDGSDYPVNNASNGPDTDTDYTINRRGKRADFFTSALPWPQKGSAISISLGTSADVLGLGKVNQTFAGTGPYTVYETGQSSSSSFADGSGISNVGNEVHMTEEDPNNSGYINLKADLTNAIASTVNDLRDVFAYQQAFEIDARSGTRYNEWIAGHWGVNHPDINWRPLFLNYSSATLYQNPVPNTSDTASFKQGHLSSYGEFAEGSSGFQYAATEHGWIIAYISFRADLTYSQGIHRKWRRSVRNDYYLPVFDGLGERAVRTDELYFNNDSNDSVTFGYVPEWNEYRYGHSLHTGALRHNYTGTLNKWHLGQEFSSAPTLSQTFIEETPPVSRVVAVTTEPEFVVDISMQRNVTRIMSMFGTPGLSRL